MQKLLNRLWPWTTLLPHLKERNSFPWLYPNISLRPAALGKPQTPFVFTEPKQLHAEKVGVPARDEVLRGRDTDPKLKNPHPAFPLTRSENSRADNLSVPLVPYEATGNCPSPVESSSFRNPAVALALALTPTHTLPSSPAPAAPGKTGREPWSPHGAGWTPSQGKNHSLLCYSHHNTETSARRTTRSLANTTSKLLSHNRLTVFQPFQADQPGVRSRLAFTSLSLVFFFHSFWSRQD